MIPLFALMCITIGSIVTLAQEHNAMFMRVIDVGCVHHLLTHTSKPIRLGGHISHVVRSRTRPTCEGHYYGSTQILALDHRKFVNNKKSRPGPKPTVYC